MLIMTFVWLFLFNYWLSYCWTQHILHFS